MDMVLGEGQIDKLVLGNHVLPDQLVKLGLSQKQIQEAIPPLLHLYNAVFYVSRLYLVLLIFIRILLSHQIRVVLRTKIDKEALYLAG